MKKEICRLNGLAVLIYSNPHWRYCVGPIGSIVVFKFELTNQLKWCSISNSIIISSTMPRNAPRSGVKQAYLVNDPHSIYRNHPLPKQIACYNFWLYLNTAGAKGWNPHENCGSVNHRRSSQYLIDNIKRNSWPKIGKVRVVAVSGRSVL